MHPLLVWSYLQTRLRHFPDRAALEAWQHRRVIALLKWVLPRSPFYRARFEGLAPESWAEAPVTDKAAMMAHFDALNTHGVTLAQARRVAHAAEASRDFHPELSGGLTVGLSSGTTGGQGLFLVSRAERLRWAGAILAKLLPEIERRPQRVAFFLRANSNLYTSARSNRVDFMYFDMLTPLEGHIARLNQHPPDVLIGPPSLLRGLAEASLAAALGITPHKVISVAEVLDPIDARLIAQAFGGPLHQVYQATEGFIAVTCAHGTLHLNEDALVVQPEWIDGRRFTPILTDFNRRAQPIIRYRLDDVLIARAEPCPCGSVLRAIEQIEGRQDDVLYLPRRGGGGLVPLYPDFVRRAIILSPEVSAYQARQHSPAHLEVALRLNTEAARPHVEAAVATRLAATCETIQAEPPRLSFTQEHWQPGPVKLRRVARLFSLPEA